MNTASPPAVGYCGLLCHLCQEESVCRCKGGNNHCGKRLSPGGCSAMPCAPVSPAKG